MEKDNYRRGKQAHTVIYTWIKIMFESRNDRKNYKLNLLTTTKLST